MFFSPCTSCIYLFIFRCSYYCSSTSFFKFIFRCSYFLKTKLYLYIFFNCVCFVYYAICLCFIYLFFYTCIIIFYHQSIVSCFFLTKKKKESNSAINLILNVHCFYMKIFTIIYHLCYKDMNEKTPTSIYA